MGIYAAHRGPFVPLKPQADAVFVQEGAGRKAGVCRAAHAGMSPICALCFALLFLMAACKNPDRAFSETVAGFDTFFMRYTDVSNFPRQERANRAMVDFLEKNRKSLMDGLNAVAELRLKDQKRYWELYEQSRASIVSSFRRLEAIDKRERMLFSVFSLVFSPDEGEFDRARYSMERDMFSTYLEMLLQQSRRVLRG
jgi:hypothetical protein